MAKTKTEPKAIDVKPRQLIKILEKALKGRKNVMVTGGPGVGKSTIVDTVRTKLGMDLILTHAVCCEPTEPKGLPAIIDGQANFLPYGDLRRAMEAKVPTVWMFDDFGQAPLSVQAVFMQLFLNRGINGNYISDNVTFVVCTNRRQDRAGVTGILEPVKGRFHMILNLIPDVEDWCAWALDNGMPDDLIACVRYAPEMLTDCECNLELENHGNPRTVAHVGELVNIGCDERPCIAGAVGDGNAATYLGFRECAKDLPDIDELLENPTKAKVPTELSALYLLISILVKRCVDDDTADAILTYANRLPDECRDRRDFSIYLIRDCARTYPNIQNNKKFVVWAQKNKDILM